MSTTLPVIERSTDIISQLLRDQQDLSAVERFARSSSAQRFENRYPTRRSASSVEGRGEEPADFAPAQARYYRDLLPASPPGPGQQYAFEVNLDKCSGCKACVVACHTLNGLEEDEAWRRVGTVVHSGPVGQVQHVTTGCHHCEDPGCLRGCPVKAYDKDKVTGIVRHLDDQCIGCKYCTMMCPYEVPKYSDRLGIVRKCDMCQQRLTQGEAPACVQACPNEAIAITIVAGGKSSTDFAQGNLTERRLAPGAPQSTLTYPTTQFKTNRPASFYSAIPQDSGVDQVAEDHWPLAAMLVTTQISIGMVLVERLGAAGMLLGGQPASDAATRVTATVALLIGGIGLGLAPLHLGQPLRAWRVFLGLRTSWLSREAVLLGKYIGLLACAAGVLWLSAANGALAGQWGDVIPPIAADAVLFTSLVLGLAGLYSSAQIYIVTGRRVWRAARTLPRFFGAAVVGGLACLVPVAFGTGNVEVARSLCAGVAFLLVLKLSWECSHLLDGGSKGDELDRRSRRLALGPLRKLTVTRFVAGAAAVVIAALLAGLASSNHSGIGIAISCGVALLVASGELCERLLYFSSAVYERMPGTLK